MDSIILNVLLKPKPSAGKDTAVCFTDSAFLKGTAGKVSGAVTYSWSPSSFLNQADKAEAVSNPPAAGRYEYVLTVTDSYGCSFSVNDTIVVTKQPTVKANAGNDSIAILGQPHQLLATGGVGYEWQPGGFLDNPFIANPFASISSPVRFFVTVKDAAGCRGTDDVLITPYKGPAYYVPSAFTPDGNGINDVFRPTPVGIGSTEYFRIFNRYGQIVFETNRWMHGWDGKFNGKEQPGGAYVWIIQGRTESGAVIERKGTVVLVR